MTLTNPNRSNHFLSLQPIQKSMQLIFDDIVKLNHDILEAEMSFLILWNDNYHVNYDNTEGLINYYTTNFVEMEQRFANFQSDCIITENPNYHTNFQGINLSKVVDENKVLVAIPIFGKNSEKIGLIGMLFEKSLQLSDKKISNLKNLAKHIEHLYRNNLCNRDNSHNNTPLLIDSLDQLPGAYFEYIISAKGTLEKFYINKEASKTSPLFNKVSQLDSVLERFELIHQKSFSELQNDLINSVNGNLLEYGYQINNNLGVPTYFILKVKTIKNKGGEILCMGMIKDISFNKIYETILEQIIFDITHVMRRPVATMLGLTNLIELDRIDSKSIKDVALKLQSVSIEMDNYIHRLYNDYQKKREDYEQIQEEE